MGWLRAPHDQQVPKTACSRGTTLTPPSPPQKGQGFNSPVCVRLACGSLSTGGHSFLFLFSRAFDMGAVCLALITVARIFTKPAAILPPPEPIRHGGTWFAKCFSHQEYTFPITISVVSVYPSKILCKNNGVVHHIFVLHTLISAHRKPPLVRSASSSTRHLSWRIRYSCRDIRSQKCLP